MNNINNKVELIEAKGVTIKNLLTFEMMEVDYLKTNYMLMCKARRDL